MNQLRVKHIMTSKVVTLFVEEKLPLIEEIMKLRHVRHLPVVTDDGRLVGLVSHRDLLAAQISVLTGLSSKERAQLQAHVPAGDVMQTGLATVSPDELVVDAARTMVALKIGCLPVVDGENHLVGIVTEADIMNLAIEILERDAK